MDEESSRTADSDGPGLDRLEASEGRADQVAQSHRLVQRITAGDPLLAAMFDDRPSDGVVQTAIQRAKLGSGDGGGQFHRQTGDGLTNVAIAMDDLTHGEPLKKQTCAMLSRAHVHLARLRRAAA